MATGSVNFASILCSRLCHDLVSPVGAISNGVEILADEDDDSMRAQVIALLEQSARQTSNRLKFFRLAFGAASGFSGELNPEEGRQALEAYVDGANIRLDWKVGVGQLRKDSLKLILLLSMLAAEALVRGGTLSVHAFDANSRNRLVVGGEGDKVIFPAEVREALAGRVREEDLTPRMAPAWLASTIASALPARLTVSGESPGTLGFTVIYD